MRVDFGCIRIGRRGKPRVVTIPNTGHLPVRIDRAELTGPQAGEFRVVAEDYSGVDVYPGRSCSVGLRFAPKGAGERRAQLWLHTSAPDSPWLIDLVGYATETLRSRAVCPPVTAERRVRVAVPVEFTAQACAGEAEVAFGTRSQTHTGCEQTIVQELSILVPVVVDVNGTCCGQGQREQLACLAEARVAIELPLRFGAEVAVEGCQPEKGKTGQR